MSKRFTSLTDWLNDSDVRRTHGINDAETGVLVVQEMIGPHDIGSDQRSVLRPRPRVKVGYMPGVTVLWTAVWEIPVEVDLTAYGIA